MSVTRRIAHALSIAFTLLMCVAAAATTAPAGESKPAPLLLNTLETVQNELDWQPLTANGGEFFILMPVKPTIYVSDFDPLLMIGGERIEKEYVASAYVKGAAFVVHVYKTPNPGNALKALLESRYPPRFFEREITVNGVKGRQYRLTGFESSIQGFSTKRAAYVIEVAARDKDNPAVNRFLSSLKLGGNNSTPDAIDLTSGVKSNQNPVLLSSTAATVEDSSLKTNIKDLTRKAVVIWKPEPPFTREARKARVNGLVSLRVELSASGQANVIKVAQGLGHGLTEEAIEAARYIRFLPAEKDGQPVPQYVIVEYHFETR